MQAEIPTARRDSGADQVSGGPLAQEQGEGVHQHGFPGPGLPGENVQPGLEGDGHVRDDGEVADPEFGQHPGRGLSARARRGPEGPISLMKPPRFSVLPSALFRARSRALTVGQIAPL